MYDFRTFAYILAKNHRHLLLGYSRTFGEVFPELLEKVGCTAYFSSYFEVAKSHLPLAEKLALGEKVLQV